MGEERCIQSFAGKSVGRNHLVKVGGDEKIILKWIFKK
jgi:hypothetical protein